ncbi:hypothetical protein B0O99DRAFT_685090 [Bisporella sp. PMI_857]|nr:hypothetical protein B0O99DRAFT_685090 [Bisporella sp. PMI_857]
MAQQWYNPIVHAMFTIPWGPPERALSEVTTVVNSPSSAPERSSTSASINSGYISKESVKYTVPKRKFSILKANTNILRLVDQEQNASSRKTENSFSTADTSLGDYSVDFIEYTRVLNNGSHIQKAIDPAIRAMSIDELFRTANSNGSRQPSSTVDIGSPTKSYMGSSTDRSEKSRPGTIDTIIPSQQNLQDVPDRWMNIELDTEKFLPNVIPSWKVKEKSTFVKAIKSAIKKTKKGFTIRLLPQLQTGQEEFADVHIRDHDVLAWVRGTASNPPPAWLRGTTSKPPPFIMSEGSSPIEGELPYAVETNMPEIGGAELYELPATLKPAELLDTQYNFGLKAQSSNESFEISLPSNSDMCSPISPLLFDVNPVGRSPPTGSNDSAAPKRNHPDSSPSLFRPGRLFMGPELRREYSFADSEQFSVRAKREESSSSEFTPSPHQGGNTAPTKGISIPSEEAIASTLNDSTKETLSRSSAYKPEIQRGAVNSAPRDIPYRPPSYVAYSHPTARISDVASGQSIDTYGVDMPDKKSNLEDADRNSSSSVLNDDDILSIVDANFNDRSKPHERQITENALNELVTDSGNSFSSLKVNTSSGDLRDNRQSLVLSATADVTKTGMARSNSVRGRQQQVFARIVLHAIAEFIASSIKCLVEAQTIQRQVSSDHVRIRWTCKCGMELFDDFIEKRPGAALLLEQHLNRPRHVTGDSNGESSSESSGSLGSYQSSFPSQTQSATSISSNTGDIGTARRLSSNATCSPTLAQSEGSTTIDTGPFPLQLWLLTCAEREKFITKLEHLDMDPKRIQSDKELAQLIKSQYSKLRSSWKQILRLRGLQTIRFVQFEVHRSKVVDIRKCPDLPALSDTNYDFLANDVIPPVGEHYLMHLFHHPEDYEDELITYNRLPKKRGSRLRIGHNVDVGIGWGIHLVEGFMAHKVWTLFTSLFLVLSLVFAITWALKKGDVQGAFGVASYVGAFSVLIIGCGTAYLE